MRNSPRCKALCHGPLQLVRQLDGGEALDISGIPDEFLRIKLCTLFDNLIQLRKNSAVSGIPIVFGFSRGRPPEAQHNTALVRKG